MAQSSEYPDLKFVESKAWGSGRDGKKVMFIVIHYTAGSERSTSAEDGAAYDQRRTDGTSTHYFVDRDSVVQCVLTKNRANAARSKGNRLGIQYELCGTVQTRAQWLDAASLPTLHNAAKQVARDCKKYGIPVRRLSVAETRRAWTDFPNGPKGIVGHVDCTNAYPEDGGDHTDPGPQFPWADFLDMVRAEMEDDDVVTPEDRKKIAQEAAELLQPSLDLLLTAVRQTATGAQQGREAEAARDAQVAATMAGMQSALASLAAAKGALTPEQVAALVEQVRSAAKVAGAEAVSALVDRVASLQEHLGDDPKS